jgi:hypothetical protein
MFRTLHTGDLGNHLGSELTGVEVTPTTFSGVVTRAGTATPGADKRCAFIYVDLDYDFALTFIKLNV